MYTCVCVCVCMYVFGFVTEAIHIRPCETQVEGSYYCQPCRCVCNWVQSIQNIYYKEAPFFRSFLHCVSYAVHCSLSEV
jgi:hypothetical protein